MRFFAMISLCVLVVGCVNDRMGSRLASWQGSHFNEVAAAWGAPAKCYADQTQQICQWHSSAGEMGATSPSIGSGSCTRMLAFDTDGIVTGWRWRGNHCQQTAMVVAAQRNVDRPDSITLVVIDESASSLVSLESEN